MFINTFYSFSQYTQQTKFTKSVHKTHLILSYPILNSKTHYLILSEVSYPILISKTHLIQSYPKYLILSLIQKYILFYLIVSILS